MSKFKKRASSKSSRIEKCDLDEGFCSGETQQRHERIQSTNGKFRVRILHRLDEGFQPHRPPCRAPHELREELVLGALARGSPICCCLIVFYLLSLLAYMSCLLVRCIAVHVLFSGLLTWVLIDCVFFTHTCTSTLLGRRRPRPWEPPRPACS